MVAPGILPLVMKGVGVSKRGKALIGPLDCRIDADGVTVIVGPNGSGKTTLLRVMHGLQRPRSGTLEWHSDIETARANQCFVFQRPVMLRRSVSENLAYPLRLRGLEKVEIASRVELWLTRTGLKEKAGLDASLLSGGEQQVVALARALATKPQLLFLDEPTSNLDGSSTRRIETILNEAIEKGTRIVMATHDLGQARRLADEIWFLHRGQLHETGEAASFFEHPRTPEAQAFIQGDIVE